MASIEEHRPALLHEAAAANEPIYYFGLGSNMLRSKIESRGDKPIEIISIEPAVVHNYRLAFNLAAFTPLEPAMASIEHGGEGASVPLYPYDKLECHGSLVKMTVEHYLHLAETEGIGRKTGIPPGYEEVVVTVVPYDESKEPVQAIALRTLGHRKLAYDCAPSPRYMSILRKGASELGLKPCYQDFLAKHPVHRVPRWMRFVAVHNMIFSVTLMFGFKSRLLSSVQGGLLYSIYVPPNANKIKFLLSNAVTTMILVPGAIPGLMIRYYQQYSSVKPTGFLGRILKMIEEGDKDPEESPAMD